MTKAGECEWQGMIMENWMLQRQVEVREMIKIALDRYEVRSGEVDLAERNACL